MSGAHKWAKQVYTATIPLYPVGYAIVQGFRGDQIWTRPYVDRSTEKASEGLKDLVESELDKMHLKKAKVRVELTEAIEPKVYGALYLTTGAELQFPMRLNLQDVEESRRLGANIEMDLGLSKHRKKIEVNSDVGDELISRLMLSDAAKMFLVRRQLTVANSGDTFCAPIIGWMTISAAGTFAFDAIAMALNPWVACGVTVCLASAAYRQFMKHYRSYSTINVDKEVVSLGKDYLIGARDYFESSMKLNRYLRRILGEEWLQNISKNGDCNLDVVPYSVRLRNIEKASKERSQ